VAQRQSRRTLIGVAGVAVLAVWATALVSMAGRTHHDQATAQAAAAPSAAPVEVAFEAPRARAVLPAGGDQVDEYPVSFPHTVEGAAAAAVAVTRYSASLDFAAVSEVLRLYAIPGNKAAGIADRAAAAAVSAGRSRLGVPTVGPAPTDTSVLAEPFAVQWTKQGLDEIDVSVLSAVEFRTGEKVDRELVATGSHWRWVGNDWHLVPGQTPTTPAAAELGTKQFNRLGWTAVAERRQ
jgi:hypothetical protein